MFFYLFLFLINSFGNCCASHSSSTNIKCFTFCPETPKPLTITKTLKKTDTVTDTVTDTITELETFEEETTFEVFSVEETTSEETTTEQEVEESSTLQEPTEQVSSSSPPDCETALPVEP